MLEVHCFGVPEGQYKLRGKWVSIHAGIRDTWHDYPVGTSVELCPVCDIPIRVLFIKGSSYVGCCTPMHTTLLMRRKKEGLCVRCGREFRELEARFNDWWCDDCEEKVKLAQHYAFNLRRAEYENVDPKREYWHS